MPQPASTGFQLSPQQKHVWNLEQGQRGTAQLVLLLDGQLDLERLKTSLASVVARHEILRTSFQRNSGMKFPFQMVNESPTAIWTAAASFNSDQTPEQLIEALLARRAQVELNAAPAVYADFAPLGHDRHVLVLSLPVLSADVSSLNLIAIDLRNAYAGELSQTIPLQYADYSEWQNDLLQKSDEEAVDAERYWKTHDFSGIPPLVLPFQGSSSASSLLGYETIPLSVDPAVLERLTANTEDEAASQLLTAWQVLLSRLTGRNEVVVAEVCDGRTHEELEGALGLFSKAVPRYANFESEPDFGDSLAQTRASRSETMTYLDYLPPPLSGLPVGFSVERRRAPAPAAGVSFSIFDQRSYTHRFDLQLRCIDASPWRLELIYDASNLQRDIVEQFAHRFTTLLSATISQPNAKVGSLPMMDSRELQQVLVDFNRTASDYPRDLCIHQLFERQAERTPDRPALRCANVEFSYAELNAQVNRLAHLLRKHGVNSGIPVGLCIERSAEMIVALLAILKAGGYYVPLAPDSPKARLEHQIAETGLRHVVSTSKLVERLPPFSGDTICMDENRAALEQEISSNPSSVNSPDDRVYVIYTSGSTGTPKGVSIRHQGLVNYSHFIARTLDSDHHPSGLHFATVSTINADLGNTCIFPALISGGCLHVIEQETALAANLFAGYALSHPIDVLKITPTHLATLLGTTDGRRVLPQKHLFLGGESLSWSLVQRIRQASGCAILNHYGPTEATIGCCTYLVPQESPLGWSPTTVPIGKPIANAAIYILDSNLHPVPVGTPGELCIGGAGIAEGYLNQPLQTAERFIKNPFSPQLSPTLYRTGDLARFLKDGSIEFLGRIDQQVKIRGFRVEPAEVEIVLTRCPGVQRAAVIPYQDKHGEMRLAAYVVAAPAPSDQNLRSFLAQHLPEYMIPSAILNLNSLPLTPNGKIDRKALPSPEQSEKSAGIAFLEARNPAEQKLTEIWKEVLKLDRVGVEDNFFQLGGHSLLATQIVSRIRNAFHVQMPLYSFLETPTIAGLAEKISQCPPAESEEDEMARLLAELEGISEEEAERLLGADVGARPTANKENNS